MSVVAQQARSFFLRCRLSSPCASHYSTTSRRAVALARGLATSAGNGSAKPYYITTPIFYVNASPHAGHLYTLVLSDILKRWQVLRGDAAANLLTGTDEHGMKVQKAAQKAKMDVKIFCDQHARQFEQLADKANISYNRFIRTTDEDHKAGVEHFWRELNHNGYIYESKHEGWYCVSDETFYPESQVHLILEPSSGRKMHASIETGKEVEWTSETNYHFKLSEFREPLLEYYREHPDFIKPKYRYDYIIKEVENGLSDLSISRPASRLTWGIPVPNDSSQTIYVWLDALLNYLTATGYPITTHTGKNTLWPPDCQVIGKDIIRFHCIYWPAFLMALGLPITKQFLTHAHWTMNNEKMSKSVGNVVNPFYAMDRFEVDTIRYYMAHDGGIEDDADYENQYIIDRYKKGLQGGFGNLISRIVRSKKWNLRECVELASTEPGKISSTALKSSKKHLSMLTEVAPRAAKLMDDLNPRLALHSIMEVVYQTNKYLQETSVWNMIAYPQDDIQREVKRIIFMAADSVRIAAILLQPYMPGKMKHALDMLGVEDSKRSFAYAQFGADYSYGTPFIEVGRAGPEGTLFPPLSSDF